MKKNGQKITIALILFLLIVHFFFMSPSKKTEKDNQEQNIIEDNISITELIEINITTEEKEEIINNIKIEKTETNTQMVRGGACYVEEESTTQEEIKEIENVSVATEEEIAEVEVCDAELMSVDEIEAEPAGFEVVDEVYETMEYTASDFKRLGVIYWGDWKWTWYSEKVLPGGGLDIPGRYIDSNGYVCDEDGYICLASSTLSKGAVVSTPFGKKGKVYDSGCASGTLDVYVSW
jgi:hypothetical protein